MYAIPIRRGGLREPGAVEDLVDYLTDDRQEDALEAVRQDTLARSLAPYSAAHAEKIRARVGEKRLVSYARAAELLPVVPPRGRRVGHIRFTNLGAASLIGAKAEMRATQSFNRRARRDLNYHLVLSYPAGETPTFQALREAEKRVCSVLGFGEHQRVSVVHHDTDHMHLHVAINRVHPRTYRAFSPWRDSITCDRVAAEIEVEQELQRDFHACRDRAPALAAELQGMRNALIQCASWNAVHQLLQAADLRLRRRGEGLAFQRIGDDTAWLAASHVGPELGMRIWQRQLGPFEPDALSSVAGGENDAVPNSTTTAPKLPAQARAAEAHSGLVSVARWLQDNLADAMRACASWSELHLVAASRGCQLRLWGRGMSVVEESTGTAVRASAVGRDLSLVQLQRRLGPFEPAPAPGATSGVKIEKRFEPQSLVAAPQELFSRWQSERLENDRQRASAFAATKAWKRNAEAALQHKRAKMLDQIGHDRPGITAWAKRRLVSLTMAAMRKGIQLAATVQRARIRRQYPGPTWTEWLRRQAVRGDEEALVALRRRYQRYTVDGSIDAIGPRPLGWAVIGVTARGTVRFSDGAGIVSHDGQRLHVGGHDDVGALRSLARAREAQRRRLDDGERVARGRGRSRQRVFRGGRSSPNQFRASAAQSSPSQGGVHDLSARHVVLGGTTHDRGKRHARRRSTAAAEVLVHNKAPAQLRPRAKPRQGM